MMRISFLIGFLCCFAGCQASPDHQTVERMRPMVSYLASDTLEGRGLKTNGLNEAAKYIADYFKDHGLKPLPALRSYFQPFKLTVESKVGEDTKLSFGDRQFTPATDFVPASFSAEASFESPVVFLGYAVSNDKARYDDFAGMDLKGKVVLALRYEPHNEKGKSRFARDGWSDSAGLTEKAKAVAHLGAKALLIVNPPMHHGKDSLPSLPRRPSDSVSIPVLMISQPAADELLKAGNAPTLETLQKQIDESAKPASQEFLNVVLRGNVQIEQVQRQVRNVMAWIPGCGPDKDEFVVVGAHYDHLGRGESGALAPNRNEIHNGADDNASGTVAMLNIASELAKRPFPNRSILFIAFTGEEQGLLGSDHFIKNCPIPTDKIAYMLNLDMVGRVRKNTLLVGGDGTAEGLQKIVRAADKQSRLVLKVPGNDVGARGGIGPSDHATFAKKQIPVLFFFSGTHVDYHRPTDDADKINYEGMADVVELGVNVVQQLDQASRQTYIAKYDTAAPRGTGGSRVQFGILPSYADSDQKGVLIDGTMPDTPAAKAGLQAGDVLVELGDAKLATLLDMSEALRKHSPGDTVKVVYLRKNQRQEVIVTLAERK